MLSIISACLINYAYFAIQIFLILLLKAYYKNKDKLWYFALPDKCLIYGNHVNVHIPTPFFAVSISNCYILRDITQSEKEIQLHFSKFM